MQRRSLLAGLAAAGAMPFLYSSPKAQSRNMEIGKVKILMGGDFTAATSQIAASRARSRMVGAFAELEIEEQAAVAKAFGSRRAGVSSRHAAMIQELEVADRASCDAMYIEGQIKGHKELLAPHKRYARNGEDDKVRRLPWSA